MFKTPSVLSFVSQDWLVGNKIHFLFSVGMTYNGLEPHFFPASVACSTVKRKRAGEFSLTSDVKGRKTIEQLLLCVGTLIGTGQLHVSR